MTDEKHDEKKIGESAFESILDRLKQPVKRRTLYLIITPVLTLIVSLILAEFLLRAFWTVPQLHRTLKGNDPIYHHSNRKAYYQSRIDSRGRPIIKRRAKSDLRVFLVGDSYAFGIVDKTEDTVGAFIEKYLNEQHLENQALVYNMALSSYSPIINYLVVKNLVIPNDPDVVLMMYDSSDMQDDWNYSLLASYDDLGRPVAINPPDHTKFPLRLETAWYVFSWYKANGWKKFDYVQYYENRFAHYRDPWEK